MAKYCTSCGTCHDNFAKFCKSCGKKFPEIQQPAPPQAQPPQYAQQPPPQYQPSVSQYQYPAQQVMSQKQKILYDAPNALNRPDQPWQVTVEGDSIVARWKWMDATFFAPHEVTNETRNYTFTVTLTDKGTWREVDVTEDRVSGAKISGGKVGFGSSSSTFIGKQNKKSFSFGVGQNNQTGETGLIAFKFNTTTVKEPIRAYLTACGLTKAGLFG